MKKLCNKQQNRRSAVGVFTGVETRVLWEIDILESELYLTSCFGPNLETYMQVCF